MLQSNMREGLPAGRANDMRLDVRNLSTRAYPLVVTELSGQAIWTVLSAIDTTLDEDPEGDYFFLSVSSAHPDWVVTPWKARFCESPRESEEMELFKGHYSPRFWRYRYPRLFHRLRYYMEGSVFVRKKDQVGGEVEIVPFTVGSWKTPLEATARATDWPFWFTAKRGIHGLSDPVGTIWFGAHESSQKVVVRSFLRLQSLGPGLPPDQPVVVTKIRLEQAAGGGWDLASPTTPFELRPASQFVLTVKKGKTKEARVEVDMDLLEPASMKINLIRNEAA